jgi:hypothetical protein
MLTSTLQQHQLTPQRLQHGLEKANNFRLVPKPLQAYWNIANVTSESHMPAADR